MDDGLRIEEGPVVDEGVEFNERTYRLIGIAGGIVNLVAFTGVGVLALDNAVYGGIAGVFAGVGSYLFLPWLLGVSALQEQLDEEVSISEVTRRISISGQLGVLGAGMEVGSVLMLAYAFSTETPEPGIGVGIAIGTTLVAYLVGSALMDI